MITIGHNYQTGKTQQVCDYVWGTSNIIKNAPQFAGQQVLFCGVLYMAEDLLIMSENKAEVFIPEMVVINGEPATPRCPMIYPQGETPVVEYKHFQQARAMNPDLVLAYVNTPASLKAEADGVYNGSDALKVVEKIAKDKNGKGKIVFIGDWNVNNWIKKKVAQTHPDFEIIPLPAAEEKIFCPTHVKIDNKKVMGTHKEYLEKYGAENVGFSLHAEVDEELLEYGLAQNAYFGGTGGIVKSVTDSPKEHFVISTVEGAVERIRTLSPKDVWSPMAVCPNMAYTAPSKVERAKELIAKGGPVAELHYTKKERPYYEVKILRPELVNEIKSGDQIIQQIPALKLVISDEIAQGAYKALSAIRDV